MLTFGISIDDQVSTVAVSAAKQVAILTSKMNGLKDAMVAAHASGDQAGLDKMLGQYEKLGKSLKGAQPEAKKAQAALDSHNQTIEMLGSASEMAEAATMAVAAALVAVAAAAAAAVVAGAALAVQMGEARQAFEATAQAMIGTSGAGAKTSEMINKLAEELPIARDKLRELSIGLMKAGVRDGPALEKAMRAAGAATALFGDQGAEAFTALVAKTKKFEEAGKAFKNLKPLMQGMGMSVKDLSKELGVPADKLEGMMKTGKITSAQLGDALENAMIKRGANAVEIANKRMGVMWDKMKTGAMDIFDGVVETEGYKSFLTFIKSLGTMFGASAGDAKKTVTSAFGSIFGIMTKVLTFGITYSLKFAVALIRVYIAMFPVIHALLEGFRWMTKWYGIIMKAIVMNQNFMLGLKVLGYALLAVVAVLALAAAPFYVIIAVVAALAAGVVWLVGLIANNFVPIMKALALILLLPLAPIILLIAALVASWDFIVKWAKKGYSAAGDFIDGIVDGITNGAVWVLDAIKNLGKSAIGMFKKTLGISSPSKIMMEMGGHMGAGLSEGLDNSQSDVEASAAGMAGAGMSGVGGAGGKGGGKSSTLIINVEPGAVVVGGGGGTTAQMLEEGLASLFERLAVEQGLITT